jgi:hypothetical protein
MVLLESFIVLDLEHKQSIKGKNYNNEINKLSEELVQGKPTK